MACRNLEPGTYTVEGRRSRHAGQPLGDARLVRRPVSLISERGGQPSLLRRGGLGHRLDVALPPGERRDRIAIHVDPEDDGREQRHDTQCSRICPARRNPSGDAIVFAEISAVMTFGRSGSGSRAVMTARSGPFTKA